MKRRQKRSHRAEKENNTGELAKDRIGRIHGVNPRARPPVHRALPHRYRLGAKRITGCLLLSASLLVPCDRQSPPDSI